MAEACEGMSWVDKLKRYNDKHTVDKPSEFLSAFKS